jgi:hypothetical protein
MIYKKFKEELFMGATAILSKVCFNFNKIILFGLSWICINIPENHVLVYGPYINSRNITINYASIDGVECTNRFNLLLNWYWCSDINGITIPNILIPGNLLILRYTTKPLNDKYNKKQRRQELLKKSNILIEEKEEYCVINILKNTICFNQYDHKNIIFEEIQFPLF